MAGLRRWFATPSNWCFFRVSASLREVGKESEPVFEHVFHG